MAIDTLNRTADVDDKASIRDALKATKLDTIVGTVDWTAGAPFPNISKTPLVGGQWRKGTTFPYDMVIVSNKDHPGHPGRRHQAAAHRLTAGGDGQRMAPLLELRGVSKAFGQVVVADDLSYQLEMGEVLGVVGPNGAGKTSMLNLISGNLRPDSGRILLDGQEITSLPAHARARAGIGRTFQIPRPFGGMTVFENVLVGAAQLRRAERLERCVEALTLAGLICRGPTRSPARSPCSTASGWTWRGRSPCGPGCSCSTRSPAG